MINARYVDGLELRIKELSKKLSDESNSSLHLIAENKSLKAERDALAVHVEALITAEPEWAKLGAILGEKQANAFKLQREHHLRELRAEAGRDGFFKGVAWILDIDVKDISAMVAEEAAKQYADSIRQVN